MLKACPTWMTYVRSHGGDIHPSPLLNLHSRLFLDHNNDSIVFFVFSTYI